MRKLKLFFACLLMAVLSIGQMWAAETSYAIEFKSTANSSDGTQTKTAIADLITDGADYVTSVTATTCYQGKSGYGIKMGKSSGSSSIVLNLSSAGQVKPTKVVINACRFGSDTGNMNVTLNNGSATAKTLTSSLADCECDMDGNTTLTKITIAPTTKRIYVKSITVYYEGGSSDPEVSVDPAALAFGTVEQNAVVAGKTFTLTGSNLTDANAVSITAPTGYTVSPTSVTPSSGAISQTVTVTPVTTTAGDFNSDITISSEDLDDDVTVALTMTVSAPVAVTGVTLDENAISLEEGATQTLVATVEPTEAINKAVTWESDNTNIATVDENGVVTAVAVGSANITCKSEADATKSATCAVTVTAHVVTPGTYNVTLNNALFGSEATGSLSGDALHDYTGQQNDITFNYVKGSGSNMYMNASQIRLYKNITLVVSVPAGFNITEVTGLVANIAANVGSISNNTWTGKSNSITFSFTASSGNAQLGAISVTYEAIAPEVTIDPSSLSFDAKQNIAVAGKTFKLTGANLTSGLTLAASTGFTVSPTSLTAEAAMAQDGVEVTVTPATPTATTTPVEGTVTISGGGLASNVVVNLSMAVTPTYAVEVAVNDNAMGSATINGGTATVYAEYAEEVTLVASANPGYEFVNWTASTEDIDLGEDAAKANGAVAVIGAAGTVTANFKAQACTGLAAPVLDAVTKTYQSATIAWLAVDNADGYVLNIVKHEGGVAVLTDEVIVAPAVSFEKTGLEANTQYDYSVMAVGDGTAYCDESNPTLAGSFTTSDYPAATLSFVENGGTPYNWGSNLKMNDVIALPTGLAGLGCSGKVLVGWDADENCATAPTYAKGADYTIASTADVLYAVFATEDAGDPETWTIDNTNFSTVGSGSGYAPYNGDHTESGITYNTNQVMLQSSKVQFQKNAGVMYNKTAFDADIVSIAIDGVDANISVYAGAEALSSTPGSGAISLSSGVYPVTSGKRYFRIVMGNATGAATSITVNLKGESSYSGYTTECDAQLPKLDAPTFDLAAGSYYDALQTVTLSATNEAAIYYTLDGTDPTNESTLYSEPIALDACKEYAIKAIAIKAGFESSEIATRAYNIVLPYNFADFAELEKVNGKEYAVRGIISEKGEYNSTYKELAYFISANGQTEEQIKCYNGLGLNKATFESADDVNLGDNVTVVGTWSTQHSNFNAANWMLEYTAREHDSYEIVGDLTTTGFQVGETFDEAILANLSVKEVFTNGYEETVAGATFNCGDKTEWLENETTLTVYAKLGDDDLTSKSFGVTVSSATLVSFVLKEGYKTEYYVGDAFVKPTVIATLSDNTHPEAEATACTGYNMSEAGNYTVNVSFTYGDITIDEGVTYQITVKAVFNNEDDPHTVAIAKELIAPYTTTSTDYMWVRGIVSQVGSISSGKLKYYISDNGATEGQLYVYDGKYLDNASFTNDNILQVNDEVVIKGQAQNYQGSTLELKNSQVISLARSVEVTVANVAELEVGQADLAIENLTITTLSEGAVTLVSGDEAIAQIVDNKIHAVAAGVVTITANVAANGIYQAASAEFTVTVIDAKPRYAVTFSTGEAGENVSGNAPEAIDDQLENAPVTLPACTWTWEGHKFTGWAVTYGENVPVEVENNQFNMPAANVTLTAQWAEVATCHISFMVGGVKKASIDKEQEVAFTIAQDGSAWAPTGFTFVGWATTEQAEETEVAPTTITEYTPQAGVAEVSLYGIYSRVEGAGETNHYVLDYAAEDLANNSSWGAYGTAYEHTAVDGRVWTIKAFKSSGMQINTTKSAYIKVPVCPANIKQIELTCNASAKKAVKFCATAGDNAEALANGSEATAQTLDLSGKSVTTGYIIPTGNCQITHIDVAYDAAKTYYTSSPVEKVTITFNANGGQGGCQTTKINKGGELTICDAVPTKSHSEFAGWKLNETTTIYQANQNIGEVEEDITLTAQWNDADTYTVTYNVNGSEDAAPTQEDQYAGDQFTLAAAVTKDGYTFKGWLYNNKLYKAGKTFTMPAANVEFVANWKKDAVATEKMTLITDAAALVDGLEFALGCSYGESNFAMAGDLGSNSYFASASGDNITLSNGLASFTSDVIILIAEKTEGGWKIRKDATNYLKETSVKNLAWGISTEATVWTISFSEGNVVIESADNTMKFNKDYPRFTTYASGQTAIQMFSKATVVTADANITDLGNVNGETVVVTSGTTLTANTPSAPEALVIQEGAKYVATAQTTTPVVHFSVTMGSENPAGDETTASEIENALNIILTTGGEIHYDITLGTSMAGTQADPNQWHAFTVPFPVDVLNGIYNAETGAKLTNEVDYAIMDYHGDIRANGQYGWKKFRGTLVPGTFYIMTVEGSVKTFRFKKAAVGALPNHTSMGFTAYSGTGESTDQGWNGIGNPSWLGGKVNYNVQVLDPYSYTFVTKTANSTNFKPGTPFFYKASVNGTMNMLEANADANYAPRRTPANEIKNVAVTFGNEVFRDKLYISASEDALNSYEQDKDLVKMRMSNTPKVAQIFGDAYGMKLSMVNTPMINDNAEVALTLYAPEAGEYTISAPEMEDADLYLTKDGAIIWNLSTSEYTTDFTKGNNEGYGLMLIKKAPGAATGTENIEAVEAGAQKVVINNNVYILRNEQMYDVTGKAVK